MISNTWLVLNSLGLIADGMYTLDNWRPLLSFDYAGQGLMGDVCVEEGYVGGNYTMEDYNETGYGFASWRLGCNSLCCKYVKNNIL